MLTDLKPCPFCGGAVKLEPVIIPGQEKQFYGVICRNTMNVGGSCAIEQVPSAIKEAAVARWNCRAIETKVIAEEQEPVARVREHDDYQATIDWLLNPLPDCTVLFDSQQPPAPCPKCAELELKVKSIRSETLAKEEQTADGFWSLYQTEKAANKILQAKVAEQAAMIEKCEKALIEARDDVYSELIRAKQSAGYKRYDDEIKRQMAQLVRHDEALSAIAAHWGKS